MPNGRFVSRSISTNEQLGRVSLAANLLFDQCIPHLDVAGRLAGNPTLVKSTAVPLRTDVPEDRIPSLLAELSQAVGPEGEPLVRWYEVKGTRVLEFPGFDRQQPGLKKDREAKSRLPSSNHPEAVLLGLDEAGTEVRSYSGPTPESMQELVRDAAGPTPPKLSEVKGSRSEVQVQEKRSNAVAPSRVTWLTPFSEIWERRYGGKPNYGQLARSLKTLVDQHGAELVLERWAVYCAATEGQFANPVRFASTFGEWVPSKAPGTERSSFAGPRLDD
jgi:hypothetical protein